MTFTETYADPVLPSIGVTVNGATSETVTAKADYGTAQAAVNVTLSEPYSADFDVPIKVTLRSNSLGFDPTNYVGLSEASVNDNTAYETVLHVSRGRTTAASSLWMYANRGSVDTEVGLLFEVNTNELDAAARAFFTGVFTGATVVINRSTPEITAELAAITAEANADQYVTINVADAYGELHEPCKYTIYWSNSGNDSPAYYTKIENLSATASGDLTFTVKYPQKGDYESLYYVVNQDGKASTKHTASVHVNAAKVVGASLLNRGKFAENEFEDQPVVTLSFGDEGFRMPDDSDWGYVFFVPKSENASNLVICADMDGGSIDDRCDWQYGYPVYRGETEVGPIEMTLLDGDTSGIRMEYDIIVRTAERIDEGDLVTSWSSRGFSFTVTNVAPNVSAVSMGWDYLEKNGGSMWAVPFGVTKQFSAETDEPSDIDFCADAPTYTNQMTAFETHWDFKLGTSTLFTTNIFGPPTTPFNYALRQAGTYTIEVKMRDKDMDRNHNEWGPTFTFTVNVEPKPTVSLAPHFGSTAFTENDGGTGANSMSRIDVNLSAMPSEQIAVQLTIETNGTAFGDCPVPTLSTYTLTFGGNSPNTTNAWFTLRNLDGTDATLDPGFVIRAAVTNTTMNSDGVAWKDVYSAASLPITIANLNPVIESYPSANEVECVINTPFTINYTFRDYGVRDMPGGETLHWTITGENPVTETATTTSSRYSGTFTTKFTTAGHKVVQLEVHDKDGGISDVAKWYFVVKPSKQLLIYPRRSGSVTSFSTVWTGAPGIGDGRVWADGLLANIYGFRHIYSYSPYASTAYAYAHGYRAGDVDDGTLTPGTDYAITPSGAYPATSNYYVSNDSNGRDSFFYAWLETTEENDDVVTTLLKLAPAYGSDSTSSVLVPLPVTDAQAEFYSDTILEAIFSKEYLPADNLGDLNADAIPDIYAVKPIWRGNAMYEVVGGVVEEGGDLFNFRNYNDDGDNLPSTTFAGEGWSAGNVPFSAEWEIRGCHQGLNHRKDHDGWNRYVRGEWVSVPCFSEAETNAVAYWNGVQTWADFKEKNDPSDGAGYVAAYVNWTNAFWSALMKSDSWIPEKRTDPTSRDTDGDSFPDGYEYFFWYKAAVGWMDGANWVRLTGVRFDQSTNGAGGVITSEEIMAAFDPTVSAAGNTSSRDTDGDGATDLDELAIGTNPIHWDSDGDGLSDGWEVTYGFNPLVPDMNLLDVPVKIGGKTVSVSAAWINQKLGLSPSWIEKYPNLAKAIMSAEAANGRMSIAECYVVGLDPEDETSDFKVVSFPMKADGTPDLANIVFEPPHEEWNVPGAQAVLKGAESLDGDWHKVDKASEEDKAKYRFFKVVVELP